MAEKLVDLPLVTKLSPRVLRILGGNPGKFTLQGTNTYLVSPPPPPSPSPPSSSSLPSILIDAAEGVQEHLDALRRILRGQDEVAGLGVKRHITDVILSHWHEDHTAGLPALLSSLDTHTLPRIHKFRNDEEDEEIRAALRAAHPTATLQTFTDAQRTFALDSGVQLHAHHTPGHTTDHLSFLLADEGIFFSGDNVLGQGTSVFEDLGAYLASLQTSIDVIQRDDKARQVNTIYPAHGPVLENNAVETLKTYIAHRLEREEQVMGHLQEHGPSTIMQIVEVLYAQYPPSLYPAAARGIYLHLHKLYSDGRVTTTEQPTLPFDVEKHLGLVWQRVQSVGGVRARV